MWIEPKDYDFKKFVGCANFPYCGKCGAYIYRQQKVTVFVSKYDKKKGQYQRKLCALCMDCYTSLLDYLEVGDI